MRNTIIITVLLFIAVIGASIYYFSDLNGEKNNDIKPFTFLPRETFLITAFNNDAATDNVFKDFEIFEALVGKSETQRLAHLKKDVLQNSSLQPFVANSEIFLSFHPDKDKISSLLMIPSVKKMEKKDFSFLLSELKKTFTIQALDSSEYHIYSLQDGHKDSLLYIGCSRDIFFATYSKDLLAKVLEDKSPKLESRQIKYFAENKSRNTPLRAYFVHDQIKNIAQHLMRSKYGSFISLFDNLGGQSAWNLNYKNDALILSGESETEQKKENYIELFSTQSKTSQDLYQYFPESTASYLSFSLSDQDRFKEDLKQLFRKRKEREQLQTLKEQILKEKAVDIEKDLPTLLTKEFAIVEQSNQTELLFVKATHADSTHQILAKLASTASDSILRFDNSQVLYSLLGDPVKSFTRPYFVQMGDIFVFANSLQVIQEYTKSWQNKDLLIGTLGFKNFERIQGNEANITYFSRTKTASPIISRLLKQSYSATFNDKKDFGYQDFFSWSFQIAGNNGKFLSNVYGIFKSKNALGAKAEWTYAFDNRPITQPWVFNHSDTSQFILIQEQDHTLHGIHPSGKKLWSAVFSGRVVGQAQQLKDRSIILVTDKSRLYRFDPMGKPLPGFSIGLAHSPSNSPTIAAVNNQQLLFIPADNQLMVYDMDGKELENWKDKTLDGTILSTVHVLNNQVFVGTTNGHFYQFDQQGKLLKEEKIENTQFQQASAVATDNKGIAKLYAVSTNNQLFSIDFINPATKHKVADWKNKVNLTFANLGASSSPTLFAMDGKDFSAYNLTDSIPSFTYSFSHETNDAAQFFHTDKKESCIGVAVRANNLIYLFDEKGGVYDGFPLEGMPLFYYGKINYNSSNYLLAVRRDKKLYAFKN